LATITAVNFYNTDPTGPFHKHFTRVTYDRSKLGKGILKALHKWDSAHTDFLL
jgi:hypothetical protein